MIIFNDFHYYHTITVKQLEAKEIVNDLFLKAFRNVSPIVLEAIAIVIIKTIMLLKSHMNSDIKLNEGLSKIVFKIHVALIHLTSS